MRKIALVLVLVTGVVAATVAFNGCGKSGDSEAGTISLTFKKG